MKLVMALACGLVLSVLAITPVGAAPAHPAGTEVASSAVTDACGPQPLKPDGSPWVCTFDDEFDGTSLDRTKWVPQTQFKTGTQKAYACYRDDPANISVGGGTLNLSIVKLPQAVRCPAAKWWPATPYTGGMVSTYHLFGQQYGRFEARVKVSDTRAPGLQEAFWMWPDDRVASTTRWPASGEIDIAETYSQRPDLAIPYLHYTAYDNWGAVQGTNTSWSCTAHRGEFNTYTLEWGPSRLEIWVNGVSCLVNTSGDKAFQKPYIVAFTQALGVGSNAYTGAQPLPATMNVDYLRVWQ